MTHKTKIGSKLRELPYIGKLMPFVSGSFKIFKAILTLVVGIVFFSTSVFVTIYIYFARGLPEIRTLEDYRPPVISEVFANDGTKIGEFWTECRIYYPFEKIPKRVIQAFVASEDARFFEHKGVDIRSIFRAMVANIKAGEVSQGGSTITQQITRSLLLSRERTMSRKVKEAILATRIERRLDKQQILTLYLNQIFLGNRAYGVGAAARNYFHKNLEELTLGQIALIAGLPTAPNSFSPINNPPKARERQEHVLRRMYEEDIITEREMKDALNENFELYVAGIDKDFNDPDAAYFIEHVRRQVKEKYGDEVLYHQGLKIYTTVDMAMQRAGQLAIRRGIEQIDRQRFSWRGPTAHVLPAEIDKESQKFQEELERAQHGHVIEWPSGEGAATAREITFNPDHTYHAIVIDPSAKNMAIRIGTVEAVIPPAGYAAMRRSPKAALQKGDIILVHKSNDENEFALTQTPELQAALYSMDPHTGFVKTIVGGYDFALSEFDRTSQALRQPGSSFKPFVYAAALDKGYTYSTTIMDSPVSFQVGRNEFWSPKNYGGGNAGPTPFKNCLQFSRNVPTVKITYDIGMHYLTAYERKMGMVTQIDKYLSMALGANVVSLDEMVPAYAVFIEQGVYHKPVTITKIVDNADKTIEELTPEEAAKPQLPDTITVTDEEKEKAKDQEKIIENAPLDKLNTALFDDQKNWIIKDKLNLSDADLRTLYGTSIPEGHVMTPQTAFLMTKLLRAVVEGGTGTRMLALKKPSGGKTGTTNDETDAWFISVMPDLVSGVWVGFDEIKRIYPGATGGHTAAPIVLDFLTQVTADWEPKEFQPPEGFPIDKIATLTGGSVVESAPKPSLSFPGEYMGDEKSGEFYEQDMEYTGGGSEFPDEEGASSYSKPPKRAAKKAAAAEERSDYPDF